MPLWWNWQTRVAANSALSASPAGKRKCAPLRLLFPKNLAARSFSGALHYFKSLALLLRTAGIVKQVHIYAAVVELADARDLKTALAEKVVIL